MRRRDELPLYIMTPWLLTRRTKSRAAFQSTHSERIDHNSQWAWRQLWWGFISEELCTLWSTWMGLNDGEWTSCCWLSSLVYVALLHSCSKPDWYFISYSNISGKNKNMFMHLEYLFSVTRITSILNDSASRSESVTIFLCIKSFKRCRIIYIILSYVYFSHDINI